MMLLFRNSVPFLSSVSAKFGAGCESLTPTEMAFVWVTSEKDRQPADSWRAAQEAMNLAQDLAHGSLSIHSV